MSTIFVAADLPKVSNKALSAPLEFELEVSAWLSSCVGDVRDWMRQGTILCRVSAWATRIDLSNENKKTCMNSILKVNTECLWRETSLVGNRDHALVRAVGLDLVTWDCRSWYLWSSWQPVPRIWPVSSQTAWHWGTGFHLLHCFGAFLELQTFRWRVHRLKSPGRVAIQPLLCEGPARVCILK